MLKTGWTDEQVLRNSHASNKRKYNTYRSMDQLLAVTPISAYPLFGGEASDTASKIESKARKDFMKQIGFEKHVVVITPQEEEQMRAIMEQAVGGELIDIDDILKNKGRRP